MEADSKVKWRGVGMMSRAQIHGQVSCVSAALCCFKKFLGYLHFESLRSPVEKKKNELTSEH